MHKMTDRSKHVLSIVLLTTCYFLFVLVWSIAKGVQPKSIFPLITTTTFPPQATDVLINARQHRHNKTHTSVGPYQQALNKTLTKSIQHQQPLHVNRTREEMKSSEFFRIDTTIEKTGKLPFLENFKSPCWRELLEKSSATRIRCLPYYYLVGAPKCGTSDLHHRLIRHPLIVSKVKEPQWVTRKRFREGSKTLSAYLRFFDEAVQKDIKTIQENGYYNSILGDSSASTLWDNKNLLHDKRGENLTIPPDTNANILFNLNPKIKIIIMLRNPITRLYSEYLYFNKRTSKEKFHEEVVRAVYFHNTCLKSRSERYCAYFDSSRVRTYIGFYYIYIEDYMRVFPRNQIKIIQLEQYSKNITGYMKDVFSFLGVGLPSNTKMLQIGSQGKTNSNAKRHKSVGEMLPETFDILYDFYKPYNDRLVKLLGRQFDYN